MKAVEDLLCMLRPHNYNLILPFLPKKCRQTTVASSLSRIKKLDTFGCTAGAM